MGRDYSDLSAILALHFQGLDTDVWRKRCWFARPAHADPQLWLATVQEVAALVGDPLPTPRDIERPRPSPVVFE